MAVNPLVSLTTSCARPAPTSAGLGFLLASQKCPKNVWEEAPYQTECVSGVD